MLFGDECFSLDIFLVFRFGNSLLDFSVGVFELLGKYESIIFLMSLFKCSGKFRVVNKELRFVLLVVIFKKYFVSKVVDL